MEKIIFEGTQMGLALDYMPRYTIEDYKLWKGEWELIEGTPYAMTPSPFAVHQAVMKVVVYVLFILKLIG